MHRSKFALGSLLFLVLLSFPLFAEDDFWMEPIAPTTGTPVTFYYRTGCASLETINRAEFTLTLRFVNGPCSPPRTEPVAIPIFDPLAAGEWTVNLVERSGNTQYLSVETMRFVVRHDPEDRTIPFRVRPSATFTEGGLQLYLEPVAEEELCPNDQCSVHIDGTNVQHRRAPGGGLYVTAPPHAQGLVDVTVTLPSPLTPIATSAPLYYFEPGNAPPSVFERVLFPILARLPGAGGSDWRTEAAISNENLWYVDNANYVESMVCVTFPCGERLAPNTYLHIDGFGFPRGIALLTPRAEAPYLGFAARVRDVSQDADSYGTALPVVREHQMVRRGAATLLDVPVDSRYRVKVRIYGFDDYEDDRVTVRVVVDARAPRLTRNEYTLDLRRDCVGSDCRVTPFYGELDLAISGTTGARANIFIDRRSSPDLLLWAFASVTNNKTQQVTIISADGNSDLCPNCDR
ncbi:MAG TPA: hypothetical protein VEK11_24055 [Thermoanaerobaculia bacterium]|nr:hypothetical protein [Thermoanaerobaculia bacterium]